MRRQRGEELKCLLISSFHMANFAAYLKKDEELPCVQPIVAPFANVVPILVAKDGSSRTSQPDFALVWTQPESVIKSFNDLLDFRQVPLSEILKEVDEYSSCLMHLLQRVQCVFVPLWVIPPYQRGLGMIDCKSEQGIIHALMRMNVRLVDNLKNESSIFFLDTEKWVATGGNNPYDPKLWYLGKIAFGNEVFKEAVKDLKAAIRGLKGESRKLVIVDLDNTLWGGLVGEVGWQQLRIGGHDPIGEAFVDFQKALRALTNRGIILGIVSKNDESVALEALRKHPEMVLRESDFAGWRISWGDKAQSVAELVGELSLGTNSVVFIDDDPAQRDRMRNALPDVLVPEWPRDPQLYKSALLSLRCFDVPSITPEDTLRARMYVSEARRQKLKNSISSETEWLDKLGIEIAIEKLCGANIRRVTQLINKTNQMNLSTRRMTESELREWARPKGGVLWAFRYCDKFGDAGLTGIVSLELGDVSARIVDFILSCRVIGRWMEETMLHKVVQYVQDSKLATIYAEYVPTAKNKPCFEFWKDKSGFVHDQKRDVFSWDLAKLYPLPRGVRVRQGTSSRSNSHLQVPP